MCLMLFIIINRCFQVVKAFVVLSQQCKNQDLESLTDELQNHVKQTTAPYKYPRKVSSEYNSICVWDSENGSTSGT